MHITHLSSDSVKSGGGGMCVWGELGLRAGPACLCGQRSEEVGDNPSVSLSLLPLLCFLYILLRQFNKDIV